jgi:predicted amidohydrolase
LQAATAGRRAALAIGLMEPSSMRNEMANAVVYVQDGEVLGVYRKLHLPVEENHYFLPGDGIVVLDTAIGRVGLSICYDMLFPEVSRMMALQGAEIMLVPSNWLDIANLRRNGETFPVARAIEGQMHVVFVNGVGELEVRGRTWSLYGRSRIVAATGEVVATAGADEQMLTATLTVADLAAGSDVFPMLRDRRPNLYTSLVDPLSAFATR